MLYFACCPQHAHPLREQAQRAEFRVSMPLSKVGRYQIQEELGRRAMGVVYRGFDPTIGRPVAIKTISLDTADPELVKRYRREAQAAGILSHPNIVTIYDAGEDQGLFYIAMELVEGETLQRLIGRSPVPVERAIPIVEQVGAALDHAHSRQIFHRDIKPANIMITGSHVKVMDFGVAKITNMGMTRSGQALGTPSYMSPELVKGAVLDGRSDIFSLGVILYEMFAWTKPFAGENITTVIYQIVGEQPQPPTAFNPSLHPGMDYVVLKALAKDPAERYQNCAELVADLKNHAALAPKQGAGAKAAWLAPAVAVGVPAVERTTFLQHGTQPGAAPWVSGATGQRRRKALLAAGAAVVLLLATVGIWQMRRTAPPASNAPVKEVAAPQPQSPPKPAATGRSPGAVTRTKRPSAPAAAQGIGRVSVHTRPKDATILVNGKATAYRSPVNIGLAPGRYRITVERSGYASETRNVVVRKDRMARIAFRLKRIDRSRSRR